MTDTALAANTRGVLRAAALWLGLGLASAGIVNAAGWHAAGNFTIARYQHTATQMADGRVLIVGGRSGSSIGDTYASTQTYNTGTGQWAAGPALPSGARARHTATLLRNGTVLIAGGTNGNVPQKTADTFDAQSGQFTAPVGMMSVERELHTATLLQDGRVLVVGGRGKAGAEGRKSAEIYDPEIRNWDSTEQMPGLGARQHTATLLNDGRVLVVGGIDNGEDPTKAVAIWNPATGNWTPAAALPAARYDHTATLLSDGRVFVAGGNDGTGALASTLLYDPAANTWTPSATLNSARTQHTAALLPDERVLLSGGEQAGVPIDKAKIFNPSGSFTVFAPMTQARSMHTALVLHTGDVLITGGKGGIGASASAELFSADTLNPATTGPLPARRNAHQATALKDGSVLVTGGYVVVGNTASVSASAARHDAATGLWQPAASLSQARIGHSQTLLNDGRVLVVGGSISSEPTASAELYNPGNNQWSAAALLSKTHNNHKAVLLPSGDVWSWEERATTMQAWPKQSFTAWQKTDGWPQAAW